MKVPENEVKALEEYIQEAFTAFKTKERNYISYELVNDISKEDAGARSYVRKMKSTDPDRPPLFIKIIPSRYILRDGSRDEFDEISNDDTPNSMRARCTAWKELFTMFVLKEKSLAHPEIKAYFTEAETFYEYYNPTPARDKNDCIFFIVMKMEKCNSNRFFTAERDIITENDLRKMVIEINNVLRLLHEPFNSKEMLDRFSVQYGPKLPERVKEYLKKYYKYDEGCTCYFSHCDIKLENVLVREIMISDKVTSYLFMLSDFSSYCVIGERHPRSLIATPEGYIINYTTDIWIPKLDPRSYDMWTLGKMIKKLSEFRSNSNRWLSEQFNNVIQQLSPDLEGLSKDEKETLIYKIPTSAELAEKLQNLDSKEEYSKPIENSETAQIRLMLLNGEYEQVIKKTAGKLDNPRYFRLYCYSKILFEKKRPECCIEVLNDIEKRLDESPLNKLLFYCIAVLCSNTDDDYIRSVLGKTPDIIGELILKKELSAPMIKYYCAIEVLIHKKKINGITVNDAVSYLKELIDIPYLPAYEIFKALIVYYRDLQFPETLDETEKDIYDIIHAMTEEEAKKLLELCGKAVAAYDPKAEKENFILTLMQ